MKAELREKAIQLRLEKQMSFNAIKEKLHVSKGTLSRWLAELPMHDEITLQSRRKAWTRTEMSRERFRKTMREKRRATQDKIYALQKKKMKSLQEETLFVAGLMLYAAEGEKKSRSDISFTNTDPMLIRFFATWVVRFLDLPHSKFRIQLHLYENMSIKSEEKFWLKELGFSKEQLWRSQVKSLRPRSFTYRDTARHGTCRLYMGSVPGKDKLMLSIRAFFDTYKRLRA